MQVKLIALAAITLAGTAFAQCGLNQITTPPNFVSNNGGAVGGMVFFNVTVDATAAPNGVSVCGIDINTSVAVGAAVGGIVYLHNSINDWNLLTGAANTPTDWDTVACITGTSAGLNAPTPCVVVNSTNSLDLAPGQYLVAVGNGNFNHRYTNGNGANQVVSDGNLTLDAGLGANVVNSPTFFNPRVFNTTFDYNVAATPVTTSPAGAGCAEASCVTVGAGCGSVTDAATIHENFNGGTFDLNGATSVEFVGTGADISSNPIANPAIMTPIAPDLGLGDDQNSALIPLGFPLVGPGLPCVDSISVASNGYIWLGGLGTADFSESEAEFYSQGARVAVLWDDLNPAAGGTIHVDNLGGSVVVTWLNVFYFGGAAPGVTMQCTITPVSITCAYDTTSPFNNAGIVGFHNGFTQPVLPASDLSAGSVGPIVSGGVGDLTLSCIAPPMINGALDMELSNVPNGGIGAVLATFGVTGPATPLVGPFPAGCNSYIPATSPSLGLILGASSCTAYAVSVPIPNDPFWIGLQIAAQGAALDVNNNLFSASNAIDSVTGNF